MTLRKSGGTGGAARMSEGNPLQRALADQVGKRRKVIEAPEDDEDENDVDDTANEWE